MSDQHKTSRPLRILVLAPQPFFQDRGTPLAVRNLLQVLSRQGYELDVLTYPEGADIEIPNCRIHRLARLPLVRDIRPGFSWKKVVYDVLMLFACFRMLRSRQWDVVHAVEESVFLALLARSVFGVPYIYDMDSSLPQQLLERYAWLRPLRRPLEWCERLAIRGSCGVVTVCQLLEEIVGSHDPTRPVVRVEDASLLDGDRARGPAGGPALVDSAAGSATFPGPLLMYVGNLEPYQGIDLLVDTFVHVYHRHPTAQLVVVGGRAPDVARYRERARRFGVASRCHFLGPRPVAGLHGWLARADILVSPRTLGRNTPMKIYSYLEAGKPILATRLPMHTQVLDEQVSCLAEPNPLAMAEAADELIGNGALCRALADRARQRAERDFRGEILNSKLTMFYETVLESLVAAARRPVRGSFPP